MAILSVPRDYLVIKIIMKPCKSNPTCKSFIIFSNDDYHADDNRETIMHCALQVIAMIFNDWRIQTAKVCQPLRQRNFLLLEFLYLGFQHMFNTPYRYTFCVCLSFKEFDESSCSSDDRRCIYRKNEA
jgi:hypothetical protein